MARRWDDKDGNGNKLTDGRVCLVIEPDDKSMPVIRTYGRDKDEVLEKLARTTETAQTEIHKLRAQSEKPAPSSSAATVSADEMARATADLANPATAAKGVKTLLKSEGVDIDAMRFREHTNLMARVAKEWEDQNPDAIWSDPRNQRLLIDTAVLKFGFNRKPSAEALDLAYEHLQEQNMIFAAAAPVPPDGNPESRTVRNATSHRSRDLRGTAPVVIPSRPKWTAAEVDKWNSRQLREKIESEPGFRDWYNKEFAKSA